MVAAADLLQSRNSLSQRCIQLESLLAQVRSGTASFPTQIH
jgi:hypothetical protein